MFHFDIYSSLPCVESFTCPPRVDVSTACSASSVRDGVTQTPMSSVSSIGVVTSRPPKASRCTQTSTCLVSVGTQAQARELQNTVTQLRADLGLAQTNLLLARFGRLHG